MKSWLWRWLAFSKSFLECWKGVDYYVKRNGVIRAGEVSLTRWSLLPIRAAWNVNVHHIREADDGLHDHPRRMLCVTLWGWGVEEFEDGRTRRMLPLIPRYYPIGLRHRVRKARSLWTLCLFLGGKRAKPPKRCLVLIDGVYHW